MLKLIKQYKEGLKVYRCDCGHDVSIPKFVKDVRCVYCGCKDVKAEETK